MKSAKRKSKRNVIRIIFLHHSIGLNIWDGKRSTLVSRLIGKISGRLSWRFRRKASLPILFNKYNKDHNNIIRIDELTFPKLSPYGWNNYPYDYYNIWIKNAGEKPFKEEPTLEMLTTYYDVIILKHCSPVSNIQPDNKIADIDSDYKSIANYKLQYMKLKEKLNSFPNSKFILFTGAAQVKSEITEQEAQRAKVFTNWIKDEWNLLSDNIFIWDLYQLQTEGGLYFKDCYAKAKNDSHPNETFSNFASKHLFARIIDVIENDGSGTLLTGEKK